MHNTIKLIASHAMDTMANAQECFQIANDQDVLTLGEKIRAVSLVELHFPAFSDGRAFSQAVQLRKRLGYQGDIRATGDVLVDQLVQMQRSGFTSAVLRADQNFAHGEKLLAQYSRFYQGDIAAKPLFATQEALA
jgi:uncharacterized protein (DUF934 family)